MTSTLTRPGFAAGSLVHSRGRDWVVLPDSADDFLVLRPLGGGDTDNAGVFPHLENVAAATFPPPTPEDAGNASGAALLRTALQVGFRASAGPFRSLASLAVEPRPYQLVPLLMAMRQDPVRLLIGDDVGIGKTVEAGLIAAELLAAGDAGRLAVLCAPSLAAQWAQELSDKFGIEATLVLPGTVTRLERDLLLGESLFDRHRHVIVSLDFIKSTRRRDDFVRSCPELVIVDEVHTCVAQDGAAGAGKGRHQRYELLRQLAADPTRHLILATATPHSGKEEGFRNLIGLLHPALAEADLSTTAGREELARYFVQRRRAHIRRYLDTDTPFPRDRRSSEVNYRLSPPHRQLLDDVLDYAREQVRDAADGSVRQRVRWWSALALLRALASSPRAAAATLRTRAINAAAATTAEADELGRTAVLDLTDDETTESADATPGADVETAPADSHAGRLRDLAARADALAGDPDAKLAAVTKVVKKLLADGYDPIVFCRFIDTAEYVRDHLDNALKRGITVDAVTGALTPNERVDRIAALGDVGGRRVLVATDCLSEGVNLQSLFQAVVHYDLAWNPTRHEQREGRVDRFGQVSSEVRAVTLYGANNIVDPIVLEVLLRKHEQIRKTLGVSVPVPERAESVLEAVLDKVLHADLAPEQLTLADLGVPGVDQLTLDWQSTADKERPENTKYAQVGIKPAEVARELAAVRAALGSVGDVAAFTREALDALGARPVDTADGFTAHTGGLPVGLRDALTPGHREPLPFHRDLPIPRHEARLDRTDPQVAAVARYVLDTALDPTTPAALRPARRCGVMRTGAVDRRTTLLLLRHRFHLTLPGRQGEKRIVAEDATTVAFTGTAAKPSWLDDDAVAALLSATPAGNVDPGGARDFITTAIDAAEALAPELAARADDLAEQLRDAHLRVRESAGQRARRQIQVAAQRPVDVLGVYVFLPTA
ncbi:helicase-related protein [Pilimelia columellifera]|uniref:Helicase-related protein n=1 Tax=Pilimelia columellifera subsp. columellifera TaxID=706583 RepID=A0ABN3NUW9_9ACTN